MSSKNQDSKTRTSTLSYLSFIPIFLILVIIPFLARLHYDENPLTPFTWTSNETHSADFFSYYKSMAFTIISAVIALIIVYKVARAKGRVKFLPLFIPLAVYGLLSLFSSILSEYYYFSFNGFSEQFETVWVLLGYCLVTYYSFLIINTEKDITLVLKFLIIGASLMLVIGLTQVLGIDFFQSELGSKILLPQSQRELGAINFKFELGRTYLTLYNPNYVGSYAALLAPLFLALLISSKKILHYITYGLLFAILFICLLASQSQAGIIAVLLSFLLFALFFRKQLIRHWKLTLCGLIASIAVITTFDVIYDNAFSQKIRNILQSEASEYSLNSIQTNDDHLIVVYKNEPFSMRYSYEENSGAVQFMVFDRNGNPLECQLEQDGATYTILSEPFQGIKMYAIELPELNCTGFSLVIDQKDWYFTNQTDGTYYYYTNFGKLSKLKEPAPSCLISNDSFLSGRGYIWSRTFPLLSSNILFGSGADTFPFVFPNDDFVSAYNGGYENTIVSKPHNMYLQIGVQSGLIALIGFLLFYLCYTISSFRLYYNIKSNTKLSFIGIGIYTGSFGYMICGLINDSTISVAPFFWVLTGVGIAVNFMLTSREKQIIQ